MTQILFSPTAFSQPYGGVSRVFCRLHEELAGRGVRSVAFAGLTHNEYIQKSRSRAIYLRMPSFKARSAVSRSAFQAFITAKRGDSIVHETYFPKPYSVPRRHTIAVTILDLIHHHYGELPQSSLVIERQRVWLSKADIIFAISDATRYEAIETFGLRPEKILTTHLGVDSIFFEDRKAASPIASQSPYFLFVGKRGGYKNWATAVTAFTDVAHDFDISMVCAGGGAFNRDEVGLLQDLGVVDRVQQRPVSDDELPGLYAGAVATLCPSRMEGFGLPSLESMATGTVPIVADHSTARELVGDFGVRVEAMNSPEWSVALANAITRPLLDRSLMQEHARQFTWAKMAERTLSGYKTAHPTGAW